MATSSGHTIKAFDEDLDRLRALISQMGGLAEHAIRESMRCLVQRDLEGAEKIVENDKKLDALEIETEKQVVRLIALRAPMAGDLRDVVAALKISSVVERIGDYAKNIAKRVPLLDKVHNIEPVSLMPEMARIATEMVHDVLNAFVERDAKIAGRVSDPVQVRRHIAAPVRVPIDCLEQPELARHAGQEARLQLAFGIFTGRLTVVHNPRADPQHAAPHAISRRRQ